MKLAFRAPLTPRVVALRDMAGSQCTSVMKHAGCDPGSYLALTRSLAGLRCSCSLSRSLSGGAVGRRSRSSWVTCRGVYSSTAAGSNSPAAAAASSAASPCVYTVLPLKAQPAQTLLFSYSSASSH